MTLFKKQKRLGRDEKQSACSAKRTMNNNMKSYASHGFLISFPMGTVPHDQDDTGSG